MLENAAVAREMKHVEKGEEGGQMGVGGGGLQLTKVRVVLFVFICRPAPTSAI